jgi:hypothetical protein
MYLSIKYQLKGFYVRSIVEIGVLVAYACGQEHLRRRNVHQAEATGNGIRLWI